eukprot:IDg22470t1
MANHSGHNRYTFLRVELPHLELDINLPVPLDGNQSTPFSNGNSLRKRGNPHVDQQVGLRVVIVTQDLIPVHKVRSFTDMLIVSRVSVMLVQPTNPPMRKEAEIPLKSRPQTQKVRLSDSFVRETEK